MPKGVGHVFERMLDGILPAGLLRASSFVFLSTAGDKTVRGMKAFWQKASAGHLPCFATANTTSRKPRNRRKRKGERVKNWKRGQFGLCLFISVSTQSFWNRRRLYRSIPCISKSMAQICITNRPGGNTVLLLHGNGEDHRIFDELSASFPTSIPYFAVDSRSHGKSSRSGGFRMTLWRRILQPLSTL